MELKNYLLLVLLFVNLIAIYGLGTKVILTETMRVFNLTSSNYPENGTISSWTVTAPDGNRLRLLCTDIYLPKNADCSRAVLSISDSAVNHRQVNLCSGSSTYIRKSKTNRLTVQFETGVSSQGRLNCVVEIFTKNKKITSASVIRQNHKQTSCPCGKTDNTNHRVSDEDKWVTEFPFMAFIQLKGLDYNYCGGSILTQRHIVTLASCLSYYREQKLVVIVGSLGLTKDSVNKGAQTLDIRKMYLHEKFSYQQNTNNIGLIVLSDDIQFNHLVKPVCLPTEHYNIESVRAVGWGYGLRDVPYKDLPVVRNVKKCRRILNLKDKSPWSYLCTHEDLLEKDRAGSPLVYKDPELGRYVLVALVARVNVSITGSTDTIANPDIYHYYNWIQNKIKRNSPRYRTCEKLEQRPLS